MKQPPEHAAESPLDELLRRIQEQDEDPLSRQWAKAMLAGEAASNDEVKDNEQQ
jgi:hypothetical protein